MSRYDSLWKFIQGNGNQAIKLTFDEIRDITGVEIDHAFLSFKKDLIPYGYQVGKISLKEKTIIFTKTD